jgi:hypothetical protein
MRDPAVRHWQRWRIAPVGRPAAGPVANRFARPAPAADADPTPPMNTAEQPGPDGIRHELVARVRREIEAGTYDVEAKWLAAEERLLRRVEEMI